eukprot:4486767-Prymnesium_polylepis.1
MACRMIRGGTRGYLTNMSVLRADGTRHADGAHVADAQQTRRVLRADGTRHAVTGRRDVARGRGTRRGRAT